MSLRHEWYQTDQKVVVTVQLKNAVERNCVVDIASNCVLVTADDNVRLELPLFHEINAADSSYKITAIKVEIILRKVFGERWPSLIKSETTVVPNIPTPAMAPAPTPAATSEDTHQADQSKPKDSKNWDKLVKDIWEEEDLEKGETDALNNLFQKIYSESTPETQRAMNKSFTESGGTVLSTNWKEVCQKKVDIKPPDGTEYKKWE